MNQKELDEKITAASKSLLSYCMSRTSNQQDAEDLAQDILYEIVRSASNLRDDRAFYSFMWSVAGNVYKQWYRKKLTVKECELTDGLYDDHDELDSLLEDNSDVYLLRRELTLLSEKYRRATILYYLESKSCGEISQILSVSESMVKYLLFKSRKILKEGMIMERKLGELSYNPKKLIPMYSGEGPNQFYSFMNNLMRQNIVLSCYNDILSAEQISLETGIPLPYLDDEIGELTEKKLLVKDGNRYYANLIVVNRECTEEIYREISGQCSGIAKRITDFVSSYIDEYRNFGFYGADFCENTLRWQLSTIMWRTIRGYSFKKVGEPAVTGWGERADIWLEEDFGDITASAFNYCTVGSSDGDGLWFFDYLPAKKGDHRDFYGNQRYIDILCDIAKHTDKMFSEYDLEAVAEMVRKGYVISENGRFRVAMPVYSPSQYEMLGKAAERYMLDNIGREIEAIDLISEKVIGEHSPRHLKDCVTRISGQNKFFYAVCAPAKIMLEEKFLETSYNPLELPTTYIVLSK